jgi:clan AA aspartic protease (TIGR02281 family)
MLVPVMRIMKRTPLIAVLVLGIAIIIRADPAGSDSTSPQIVFDKLGLTQSDVWLILPDESVVHDGVGKVKHEAETVHIETTSRRDLRLEVQGDKHDIEMLLDNLVDADTQMNQLIATRRRMSTDDPIYPQLVNTYNAAANRRDSLSQQVSDQEKAEADAETRLEKVSDSRGQYVNLVMDVATQAESAAKTYAALSQDRELAEVIASANATAETPMKLGPSPAFSADLNFLRKAVKDVVDAPIPVRRDPDSDELYVETVINGTTSIEMLWDSGADQVALSADTARQLGIRFTNQDPTVEVGTAGTDTIKVHRAMLDSIRLGGFTVRNVPCIVLPDNSNGTVVDLLGDTFQTHFISRMDQRSNQLQLTPVDSSVLVGAIPHQLAPAR